MWIHVPPSFLSAPASGCSTSDSDWPSMLAQSATWSGKFRPSKSWRTAWTTGRLTPLRCGPTLKRLMLEDSGASTFSPEESPVNPSHPPATGAGTTITAPSRLTCCGSSQSVCLPWCSSRTFLPGFFEDTPKTSSSDFLTWATASRTRSLSERRTSALRTGASASSSWPTATAGDSKQSGKAAYSSATIHAETTLTDAIRLWPTPRAISGGAESTERKQQLGRKNSGGGDLQAAIADFLPPGPPPRTATGPQSTLTSGRRLNPLFVEWLMGLPRGYTDSAPLATASFLSWRQQHFEI